MVGGKNLAPNRFAVCPLEYWSSSTLDVRTHTSFYNVKVKRLYSLHGKIAFFQKRKKKRMDTRSERNLDGRKKAK
jgi:hypothetical protein